VKTMVRSTELREKDRSGDQWETQPTVWTDAPSGPIYFNTRVSGLVDNGDSDPAIPT
jgi:hypothetical protein